MKIVILIIGIAIGAVAVWYYRDQPKGSPARDTGERIESSVRSAGESLQEKLRSWDLDTEKIKAELNETGKVVRQKTRKAGERISDATADARTTTTIKGKLVRDPDLSAWDISVSTTDGVVTLSGSVTTPDLVGKAMLLAMETDGVREVISTLQVKASREP